MTVVGGLIAQFLL